MSIVVRDSGDIYFDGTNNVSVMSIFVDGASDLQGLVQYEDIYFQLGSDALDVSTGNKYRMKSNGTWVLQPDNMWQNVYTKTEVDSIVSGINALDTKQTQALAQLISSGGKNRLKHSAVSRTHNGVTFTVNADGTITANGTATANAYISLTTVNAANEIFDGTCILSGCPTGGVYQQNYALYAAIGSYTKYDLGNGVILTPPGLTGNITFIIMVYSGYAADNLVFKPMVCKNAYWEMSHEYEPYCPTLSELYAMVKSYHP